MRAMSWVLFFANLLLQNLAKLLKIKLELIKVDFTRGECFKTWKIENTRRVRGINLLLECNR